MPGLVPGIHVLLQTQHMPKTWMAPEVGLARLPNQMKSRKSGKPRLAVTQPGHDAEFVATAGENVYFIPVVLCAASTYLLV